MRTSRIDGVAASARGHKALALLLLDGHHVHAEALAGRLRTELADCSVHITSSAETALALIAQHARELVILEEDDSTEALRDLRALEASANLPNVVVLSMNHDTSLVVAALQAGARGWLTVDVTFETLLEGLEWVENGEIYLSPPVLTPVLRRLLPTAAQTSLGRDLLDGLTPRQVEVLRCLVAGMTTPQIAARLFVSVHTVRSHVQRLMGRADRHSTVSLVALARELGIPPIDDPPSMFPATAPSA